MPAAAELITWLIDHALLLLAVSKEYLDKNFGPMLIVWDWMFGTFAPVTVPARYGLAGGKRVAGPLRALAGGYPALLAGVRAQDGVTAGARYLVAAP